MDKMKRLPDLMKMASFKERPHRHLPARSRSRRRPSRPPQNSLLIQCWAPRWKRRLRTSLSPPRKTHSVRRVLSVPAKHPDSSRHEARNRPLHHLRRRSHPQPRHRRPQHRHVPRPDVQRQKSRHALAHAPRRRTPFPHVPGARRENAPRHRPRRRTGPPVLRNRPTTAGNRRTSLGRLLKRLRHRAGEVQNHRPRSPCQ